MVLELSSLSILIPAVVGVIFWNKLLKIQKYFYGFICFSIVIEGLSVYTNKHGIDNHDLFKFFLICDLLFFIWFFNKTSIFPTWFKIITWLIVCFVLAWEISTRLIPNPHRIDSIFYIVIFLYFVVQCRQVILNLFDNLDLSPTKNYLFWISTARLLYYLFIMFIYVYPNLLDNSFKNKMFTTAFIVINTSGNILSNIMYGISFYARK